MSLSRRSIILAAGGASLALVGGALGYRVSRLPASAMAPWSEAATDAGGDPRLAAFRYAILAPNPHNRQPWLIRLEGESEAVISCDLDRRLPETDPFDRQVTIGFGAFLELARMAAAENGHSIDAVPFPDGEPDSRLDSRPVARLRFRRDASVRTDPLFAYVLRRRSNKEPYDLSRPVKADAVDAAIARAGDASRFGHAESAERVGPLRRLIVEAAGIEFSTARTYMESVRLMRIGAAEIDANPDGIALKGPLIEGLSLAGQINREKLADMQGVAYASGRDRYMRTLGATPAFVWLATPANTRIDQLAAGRDWVRLHLAMTEAGLSLNPASQALQEFPEMAGPFAAAHRLLDVASNGGRDEPRVQMLARLGYGPEVKPSHRWPLQSRILQSNPPANA